MAPLFSNIRANCPFILNCRIKIPFSMPMGPIIICFHYAILIEPPTERSDFRDFI